jgi:apolipoprotein N-acyltransferase
VLKRFREFFLIAAAAGMLVVPFHLGGAWILAFGAFVPYFAALEGKSSSEAFKISYLFGCLFFAFLGFWLTLVNVIGYLVMVAYLALYFGFFGMFVAPLMGSVRRARPLFFIPAAWVVLEYLRGWIASGIPWALLAYSQWKNIPFIQFADLSGAYGVSFVIVLINLALYRALRPLFSRKPLDRAAVITLAAAVLLPLVYGFFTLGARDAFYKDGLSKAKLRVTVLQGNIPQEEKWDARIKGIIFEKYRRLTFMGAVEKSDLIVWPETSFPGYLEDEPIFSSQLRNMVRQSRTEVLVGAPTLGNIEEGLRFYNSAVHFGPDGEERARYHKLHLVPFGEYIPFEPVFGFIRNFYAIGRFSHGSEATIFTTETRYQEPDFRAKFGVLICYEDIFPGLVRRLRRAGADFLINMTNDAWFGRTTAPYQHAQASVFRAVENRVPVVRATNTGFSCFISAEGRILSRVHDNEKEIFVTGHQGQEIVLRKGESFYTRFGDVFMLLAAALAVLAWKERSRQNAYTPV